MNLTPTIQAAIVAAETTDALEAVFSQYRLIIVPDEELYTQYRQQLIRLKTKTCRIPVGDSNDDPCDLNGSL